MQRSVLITGCSSGIGLDAVRALRQRDWRVIATARKPDDLARLKRYEGVEALHLELADPKSIATCAVRALEMTNGSLYALFNNAAFGQPGAVEDLTPALLREQFEVNVVGTHDLTRRVIPSMRRRGEGRVVNCSSVLGMVVAPYRAAYCASKFALEALTTSLRLELEPTGIRVALIEPGPIRSRFVEHVAERLLSTIDIEHSHHRDVYRQRLDAMREGVPSRFKLEPEAVSRALVHALESRRPRKNYFVTTPTKAAAVFRRVLPQAAIDYLAKKF